MDNNQNLRHRPAHMPRCIDAFILGSSPVSFEGFKWLKCMQKAENVFSCFKIGDRSLLFSY